MGMAPDAWPQALQPGNLRFQKKWPGLRRERDSQRTCDQDWDESAILSERVAKTEERARF